MPSAAVGAPGAPPQSLSMGSQSVPQQPATTLQAWVSTTVVQVYHAQGASVAPSSVPSIQGMHASSLPPLRPSQLKITSNLAMRPYTPWDTNWLMSAVSLLMHQRVSAPLYLASDNPRWTRETVWLSSPPGASITSIQKGRHLLIPRLITLVWGQYRSVNNNKQYRDSKSAREHLRDAHNIQAEGLHLSPAQVLSYCPSRPCK